MPVEILTEADSRFIADNMLTADDFDMHKLLDLSFNEDVLCHISNDTQIPFKYPTLDLRHCSLDGIGIHKNSQNAQEMECELDGFMRLSPGCTSDYSSQGSWNEECSIAEIGISDNEDRLEVKAELPETPPPDSPPAPPPSGPPILPCDTSVKFVSAGTQPLILTTEQFARLVGRADVDQCAVGLRPCPSKTVDAKAMKRQQRMIKNRESACLSRKKKKEHLQRLETEVKELVTLNTNLQLENQQLRQRIGSLETEVEVLRGKLKSKDVKKTTCLMAVLFMLTLNIAPFGSLLASSSGKVALGVVETPKGGHVAGRSLLWNVEPERDPEPIHIFEDVLRAEGTRNGTICHVNKTESLRLENELRGWAMRVEKHKPHPPTKKLPIPSRLHTWFGSAHHTLKGGSVGGQKGVQIYSAHISLFEELFDAIHRRDDTFYFVSFSGDHLLLPATAHNKTQRPKMSLVMPAMTLNETEANRVGMMQIDCEVTNTRLVYIKESSVPAHLRPNNRTSRPSALDAPFRLHLKRRPASRAHP